MSNYITTAALNLRKQPEITSGNVLSVLPPGTVVEELNATVQSGFREVKTILANVEVNGFASQKYLQPTALSLPPAEAPLQLPAVHLDPGTMSVKRSNLARAYPLNESGLVKKDLRQITDAQERTQAIADVLNFLDVEHSARYAPNSTSTYCNIYAYDVAWCLGAYLPRVWWTADAIVKWQQGKQVPVQYENTVTELTANRITDWFEKFGSVFGWVRQFDLTAFQNEVNTGQLGILVAQRINMNNSGHIVAVVPETGSFRAKRNGAGQVIVPLQSQAGRNNRKYSAANPWWEDKTRFRKFGLWLWKM